MGWHTVLPVVQTAPASYRVCMLTLASACQELPMSSRYADTEVSYADAQPGDLICYGGHVAIYMGNGQIVHASNAQDGIKISNNAAYRTITSVRRLV